MDITDNELSAFFEGQSSIDEDRLILDSMSMNEEFSDMIDMMNEINSMGEISEMRDEFNELVDGIDDYEDYNINIR